MSKKETSSKLLNQIKEEKEIEKEEWMKDGERRIDE